MDPQTLTDTLLTMGPLLPNGKAAAVSVKIKDGSTVVEYSLNNELPAEAQHKALSLIIETAKLQLSLLPPPKNRKR